MGKRYQGPETYNEAMRFLDGADSRVWNGLRSTRFHLVGENSTQEGVAMEYHYTDVVTWLKNGDIIIDSGGWETNTTKHRLGAVTRVWQDDGGWYFEHGGVTYDFARGAVLHPDGSVTGATPTIVSEWNYKFDDKLETTGQLVEKIQQLDFEGTLRVWKKLRKHRRFIAAHCIMEFVPTILGVDDVRDIVSERMREAA